jgi:hypothetical protein
VTNTFDGHRLPSTPGINCPFLILSLMHTWLIFIGILITAAFHHELHIFFSSKTISATFSTLSS